MLAAPAREASFAEAHRNLASRAPSVGLAAQLAELRHYLVLAEEAVALGTLADAERASLAQSLVAARRVLAGASKARDARRARRFLCAFVAASGELERHAGVARALRSENAHAVRAPNAVVVVACSDAARRVLCDVPKADEADRLALRDAFANRLRQRVGATPFGHASADELLARVANKHFGVAYTPTAVLDELAAIDASLGGA